MERDGKERGPGDGARKDPHKEEIDSCGLCASLLSRGEGNRSCGGAEKSSAGGAWRFMTEREFRVLHAMRALREKAAKIKKRVRAIEKQMRERPRREQRPAPSASAEPPGGDADWEREMAEELLRHCDRLAQWKARWQEMDRERMAAQEERMRLLGHIQ